MRYNAHKHRIGIVELTYLLIGALLLLLMGTIAKGQSETPATRDFEDTCTNPATALQGISRRASRYDGGGSKSKTWRAGDEE